VQVTLSPGMTISVPSGRVTDPAGTAGIQDAAQSQGKKGSSRDQTANKNVAKKAEAAPDSPLQPADATRNTRQPLHRYPTKQPRPAAPRRHPGAHAPVTSAVRKKNCGL
jgi:hypothetical protein